MVRQSGRLRLYENLLDDAMNKKTPKQRRTFILKAVVDEMKDIDVKYNKDGKWKAILKKFTTEIGKLEKELNLVNNKKAFDKAVMEYAANTMKYAAVPKKKIYVSESESESISISESSSESEESEDESEEESEDESEEDSEEESEDESITDESE